MDKNVELNVNGKACRLPIVEGSEKELAIDISALRSETGYITLDDGYANTGSCLSKITFIDGEQGILRYRGIPIEELAEKSTFIEVAHLIVFGRLPNSLELRQFSDLLFKIWPEKPLEPGEYALLEYSDGKVNPQVWDFSVGK